MQGCFFVLARFFLRIDGVLLRIHDTRYYHAFNTDVIVRERSTREAEFTQLSATLPTTMLRDSDAVAEQLPVQFSIVENLRLSDNAIPS
jgi:type 2A phosphatase activator TIP41